MTLMIARSCWAAAYMILMLSFFLVPTLFWQLALIVTALAGVGLIRLTSGAINGILLFSLLGLIFIGAVEHLWTVNLIFSLILGLAGFQLTTFAKRYQFSGQPDPPFEMNHLRNVGMISLGALILSLIGLTVQLDLGFWPVLGLGIFLLFTLVMVFRKAQAPPSD